MTAQTAMMLTAVVAPFFVFAAALLYVDLTWQPRVRR